MPPPGPGLPTLSLGVPSPKLAVSGVEGAWSPGSPQGVPAPPEFGVLVLLMHSPSRVPHCHAVLGTCACMSQSAAIPRSLGIPSGILRSCAAS